jgi:hypothetical protein
VGAFAAFVLEEILEMAPARERCHFAHLLSANKSRRLSRSALLVRRVGAAEVSSTGSIGDPSWHPHSSTVQFNLSQPTAATRGPA